MSEPIPSPVPAQIKLKCGIIMPISEIDGCGSSHWKDVLSIVKEAINETPFEANLVSSSDESGVIQKRIVTNLYENPIAVCDVSGKNPNVMFELGMRLAFDKPTVIIKDDKTDYSFDTSPIEHLTYPRDLRFQSIVEFKANLKIKLMATHQISEKDPTYSCFLKHFVQYKAKDIPTVELPAVEAILKQFGDLKNDLSEIKGRLSRSEVAKRNSSSSSMALFNVKGSDKGLFHFEKWLYDQGMLMSREQIAHDTKTFFVKIPPEVEFAALEHLAKHHDLEITGPNHN